MESRAATVETAVVMRHGRRYGYVFQSGLVNTSGHSFAGSANVPPIRGLRMALVYVLGYAGSGAIADPITNPSAETMS